MMVSLPLFIQSPGTYSKTGPNLTRLYSSSNVYDTIELCVNLSQYKMSDYKWTYNLSKSRKIKVYYQARTKSQNFRKDRNNIYQEGCS